MRGAADEAARGLVVVAHVQQCVIPHCLGAHHAERHVYALERHHVDLALPFLPAPPGGRVAHRTVIHICAAALPYNAARAFRGDGQALGQLQAAAAVRYAGVQLAFQIGVQRAGDRHRRAAAQRGPALLRAQLPHLAAVLAGHFAQRKLPAIPRQQALYQSARRLQIIRHASTSKVCNCASIICPRGAPRKEPDLSCGERKLRFCAPGAFLRRCARACADVRCLHVVWAYLSDASAECIRVRPGIGIDGALCGDGAGSLTG